MYQRDYILRAIEMLGEVIKAFLGFLKKGEYPEAQKLLFQAYRDFLKEDAAFFHSIPADRITQTLLTNHNYTHHHLEILAELFFLEAELNFKTRKYNIACDSFEKALLLFRFIEQHSQTFSMEKQQKIAAIKERILQISQ